MEELRKRILESGRVESQLVIVDSFLNHRTDPRLMTKVGIWLAEKLGDFDVAVTAEASGIPAAFATARAAGKDFIYAKKQNRQLDPELHLLRQISSPTKGGKTWITIRKELLGQGRNVVIVDDFLSRGRTAEALGSMIEEAGNRLSAFGFVIEKTFTGGRSLLESHGWRVESAAIIESIENQRINLK
ncbi:MAG: phosphoribosyltransferase family protein [bacterium]|nr:xanthine phosphoribosyltransferase [Acidimicrobiia bacterium]MCY4651422.1 phosphoribosyltransferase family protein [bacterium]